MYAGEKQFAQKVEIKICNVFFKVRSLNLRPFSFQELLGGKNAIMSQSNSYNFLSSWLVSMCSVIINLSIYCILKLSRLQAMPLYCILDILIPFEDLTSILEA